MTDSPARKFRKKPVVIEAFRWPPKNMFFPQWFHKPEPPCTVTFDDETAVIHTLEGDMVASKGDWIIRGVSGEIYPCKPDIFEMTYDLA